MTVSAAFTAAIFVEDEMPDSQDELQADQKDAGRPYTTLWFETRMGVQYVMPDMLPMHVESARQQLYGPLGSGSITLMNVSGVCMVIPRHILKKAGCGERCFWEALAEGKAE